MIGAVNANLEAVIFVPVRGDLGDWTDVECIIDTGFSGVLTLPRRLIEQFQLQWISMQNAELADGSIVTYDVYAGKVVFGGREMVIAVDHAETEPLLGMGLLHDFEVLIQVQNGGSVRIAALP